MEPIRSTASVVAIVCSIASFVMTFRGRPGVAFTLGGVAIVAGILGFLRSVSPRVKGGVISLTSVVLGALAMLVALLGAVF